MKTTISPETRDSYRTALHAAVEAVAEGRAYGDACITYDPETQRFEYWNSASIYRAHLPEHIAHANVGTELPWHIETHDDAESIAAGTDSDPFGFIREVIASLEQLHK